MEFGDASGRAEVIEKLLRDLGNAGGLGMGVLILVTSFQ